MVTALDVPNYREDEDQVYGSGNPFLNCPSRESPLDQAMEMMQVLGSRRSPSVYKVTNSQGRVVNLCLFKTSYRLGEDVVGTLDFSEAVVSCMQVVVGPNEIFSENSDHCHSTALLEQNYERNEKFKRYERQFSVWFPRNKPRLHSKKASYSLCLLPINYLPIMP